MATRRRFLAAAARAAPVLGGAAALGLDTRWGGTLGALLAADRLETLLAGAPVARFWTSVEQAAGHCEACHLEAPAAQTKPRHKLGLVQCQLCAQRCGLAPGERGRCRARINVAGQLRSLVYGRPSSVHVDPIEKKPFYHFLPGASAFSFGTAGCPLRCKFCQNWELSQSLPEDHETTTVTAPALVETAVKSAPVIAFTYNEPTVFTEFLLDTAQAARGRGLRSVLISCGLMNEAPLDAMCDALAAIKIDLKGFSEDFYHNVSGAELKPVLRSIRQVHRRGVHLEIVNLVVPTLNDAEPLLTGLADWIMGELGPDVPLHFTRFHPEFQLLNLAPTPVATLERARDIARAKGLHYVYVGNVPGHPGNHTYCPRCQQVVIRRAGFFLVESKLRDGQCPQCRHAIPGVWS
jgi:pyruvate formate lyase activating enzyme